MPNHRTVPRWRYGDILTNDEPSNPAEDHTARAMFVAWKYTSDSNPTESVCVIVQMHDPMDASVRLIEPYCGWWTDA